MDILIVTAELSPFCTDGEVGESVASLGKALVHQGHQVTFIMPKPSNLEAQGLMVARRLSPLELSNGAEVTVFDGQLASGVPVLMVESEQLEARADAYSDNGKDHPDIVSRVAELARVTEAVVNARVGAGKPFDVVLGQGLAGALLPFVGLPVPTVLSIHDPKRLGACTFKELEATGLLADSRQRELFKLGTRASLLKGGALAAEVLTCVSIRVAEQLKDPTSSPLAAALCAADKEAYGVAGGIDYAVYNPATDSALHTRFDAESSERKGLCKSALSRELELELDPDLPLVCWTADLSKDAGVDLLVASLPKLLALPLRLVVLDDPDPEQASKSVRRMLSAAKYNKLPNYRFVTQTSPATRRRVLAASDLAICVERQTVSGHSCRVAQRYGAIPIALDTPGAGDVVVDCEVTLATGTGFLFADDTAEGLLSGISRAVSAASRPGWGKLRRRVMKQDLGWERAARRYAQLFKLASRKLL